MPLGVRIHVGTDPSNPFIVPGASVYEEMRPSGRNRIQHGGELDRGHTERRDALGAAG